jgi:hypothetical protein
MTAEGSDEVPALCPAKLKPVVETLNTFHVAPMLADWCCTLMLGMLAMGAGNVTLTVGVLLFDAAPLRFT